MATKFDIFMIDPPWPKRKGGRRAVRPNQGRELDYQTMSVGEIFTLMDRDIFSKAKTTHVAFVWTVDEFLSATEAKMLERGYRRHARLIWDKTNGPAPAFTVRYSHEYLIWFYKPKFFPVALSSRGKWKTVLTEPAREHSRKPEIAFEMLESFFPTAQRLDVFSREKRNGWDQYGNQIDYFQR